MASMNADLGDLERLPLELREMIYNFFLPWSQNLIQERRLRRWRRNDSSNARNSLSLFRTSRTIHGETTRLLYDNCNFVFTLSSRDHVQTVTRETGGWHALIEVCIVHCRHGITPMPALVAEQGLRGSTQRYKHVPYRRFRNVIIELHPLHPFYWSSVVLGWRSMKMITDMLQQGRDSPAAILIKALGSWARNGRMTKTIRGGPYDVLEKGNLHLMLLPLRRLEETARRTEITLEAEPSAIAMLKSEDDSNSAANRMRVSHQLLQLNGALQASPPFISATGQQNYVDACFELLNDYSNSEEDWFRDGAMLGIDEHRWRFWDTEYERFLISTISRLPRRPRESAFKRFTFNWAVHRALSSRTRSADWREWRGEGPLHLPEPSTKEATCAQKWSAQYNFRFGDRRYKELLRRSLIFYRRILITTRGIGWDPEHTEQSSTPRVRSDLLHQHDPASLAHLLPAVERFLRRHP